eukprot:2647240-Amphidinium_carterae.1
MLTIGPVSRGAFGTSQHLPRGRCFWEKPQNSHLKPLQTEVLIERQPGGKLDIRPGIPKT